MRLARLELSRLPLTATASILSLAVTPVLLAQVPTPPVNFVGIEPCRIADTRGNGFTGQYGPPALAGAFLATLPSPASAASPPSPRPSP